MPIFHNEVQQGSEEWLRLRSGIPTASRFSDILTKSGKPSASAERYLYTLLAERLIGHPVIEHVSMWQQRGTELEADALSFFELQTDLSARPIGFVTNGEGTWGASPDALVGDDAILEIKCPSEYQHCMMLMQSGSAYEAHKVQVQGQLLVTARRSAWVLSYNPEMPPALTRVERDEPFLKLLSAALNTFSLELERQFAICQERGWAKERKAPKGHTLPHLPPLENLVAMMKGIVVP
jgi:putative phage-type endonuclease